MRGQVQGLIQRVLEDEVTECVGRTKSQRRAAVDAPAGYRNGYGKPRRLTWRCGTITVRHPWVRDCEERFESRVLPLCKRKSTKVDDVVPELYLHGLAQGDFELALRGLLGDEAPLSSSTVARLKEKWQAELARGQSRRLDGVDAVYCWVDGIYVKAGLEKEKAALLVVLAALSDGRKVVRAVTPGHRESTASWSASPARSRAAGAAAAPIGDRRWSSRHLGRTPQCVSGGGGAAVRESHNPHCARQAAQAAADGRQGAAVSGPLCGDAPRGRTAA